jgi:hypothetical protein
MHIDSIGGDNFFSNKTNICTVQFLLVVLFFNTVSCVKGSLCERPIGWSIGRTHSKWVYDGKKPRTLFSLFTDEIPDVNEYLCAYKLEHARAAKKDIAKNNTKVLFRSWKLILDANTIPPIFVQRCSNERK